jgi:hypothetical protein
MNNCPGRRPGPRPVWPPRPWPRRLRLAAVIAVLAAATQLAAACSGGPSSAGTGGSPAAGGSAGSQAVAYSRCVRSHGVPNFPDPDSSGQIPKEAVVRAFREVGESQAKAATAACANLNPAGQGSPILTAQEQQDYLRAAACMRSHGITNFPDPTFPGGRANLPTIPASIDTKSRQFTRAAQTCIKLIPAGLPYSGNSGSGG